ncbi:MAG: ribose 5-phosphate isomerase B [Oscillospiraceae bacterium]|nr:ribose 5-phosphate isomerase B [Oscillospiraceae bacterium]
MKIAIACDHGALALKNAMKKHLEETGCEVMDFGTHTLDSCDYPDFAAPAAKAVASGECDKGIVMCTTGIGVSITCNKVKGIRCALLSDVMSARMTREHNDTNMMALGAGVVGEMLALEIADTWLSTEFSGGERHQRRIDKMMLLEK